MTQEQDIEILLQDILNGDQDTEDLMEEIETIRDVSTYDDVGMMTRNKGVVVTMDDGTEFQITIVKSR